jgi:hypothetical protein
MKAGERHLMANNGLKQTAFEDRHKDTLEQLDSINTVHNKFIWSKISGNPRLRVAFLLLFSHHVPYSSLLHHS